MLWFRRIHIAWQCMLSHLHERREGRNFLHPCWFSLACLAFTFLSAGVVRAGFSAWLQLPAGCFTSATILVYCSNTYWHCDGLPRVMRFIVFSQCTLWICLYFSSALQFLALRTISARHSMQGSMGQHLTLLWMCLWPI